jgi:hypothetical protein
MRTRRVVWIGIAACATVLAFGATTRLLRPVPSELEADCRLIRPGMTQPEVDALLARHRLAFRSLKQVSEVMVPWEARWEGPTHAVSVHFFGLHVVGEATLLPNRPAAQQGLLDVLRRLVGSSSTAEKKTKLP